MAFADLKKITMVASKRKNCATPIVDQISRLQLDLAARATSPEAFAPSTVVCGMQRRRRRQGPGFPAIGSSASNMEEICVDRDVPGTSCYLTGLVGRVVAVAAGPMSVSDEFGAWYSVTAGWAHTIVSGPRYFRTPTEPETTCSARARVARGAETLPRIGVLAIVVVAQT